jgi:hypothetical protein
MESMRGLSPQRRSNAMACATKIRCAALAAQACAQTSAARGVAVVALAQLVEKLAQPGRQIGTLGPQVLLQPFAYGIADRPAGLVVHLLAVIGLNANHDGFRWASLLKWCVSLKRPISNADATQLFPPIRARMAFGKICMKIVRFHAVSKKAPASRGFSIREHGFGRQ